MKNLRTTTLALALLLPLGAQAGSVRDDIRHDMAEARSEVRTELANARAELATENLEIGDSFHFGKQGKRNAAHGKDLPKAEITPRGDLLIEGRAVAINATQRQQLLGYRGLVIDIARDGIDAGEHATMAALEATDTSLFGLIWGGMTGSLERRVERTVKQHVEPMVRRICQRLPALLASQQQLAASTPQFRPYASLQADDVEDCEADVRNEFAMR